MHALVTADAVGGVWTYARELVTGLVRRGVRVTLVSFGKLPEPDQLAWMEGLAGLDFRPTGFRLEWMQEAARDLALSADYLRAVVDEVEPDIVHLNQYAYGALELGVPKVVVAHSDVVSWWVAVHGEGPLLSPWMRWYRETVRRGLAGADVVVAPSCWMMEQVRQHYGKPARERVIHNGRTPALFDPGREKRPWALSVGRLWDQGKQVSLLTRIEPPMPVVIAGAERHPEAGEATERAKIPHVRQHRADVGYQGKVNTPTLAPKAGAKVGHQDFHVRQHPNKIEFAGQLGEDRLRELYGEAVVYVATSCYEPFGLAPVEAALSRCALVVNDIPSLRELWGDAAYYFAMNDVGSLSRALRHLAADPELCISYGKQAHDHARRHFIAERMVDGYVELYETLVTAEVAAG